MKPDIEAVKARVDDLRAFYGRSWESDHRQTAEDLAALLAHCAETEAENEKLRWVIVIKEQRLAATWDGLRQADTALDIAGYHEETSARLAIAELLPPIDWDEHG